MWGSPIELKVWQGLQQLQCYEPFCISIRDVMATVLVHKIITKKFFWKFDSIIMQNLNDILPLAVLSRE